MPLSVVARMRVAVYVAFRILPTRPSIDYTNQTGRLEKPSTAFPGNVGKIFAVKNVSFVPDYTLLSNVFVAQFSAAIVCFISQAKKNLLRLDTLTTPYTTNAICSS